MNSYYILSRAVTIAMAGMISQSLFAAEANNGIKFNEDLLDVTDKDNIKLDHFSTPGYILPGEYEFEISLNNKFLTNQKVNFIETENKKETEACLTQQIVNQFGLLKDVVKKLEWDKENDCLIVESLNGMTVKSDLATGSIKIKIPQSYLEYQSENWDPPALWDNGINGVLFDYNILSRSIYQNTSGLDSQSTLSANGVVGLNIDAWRIRANWQADYKITEGSRSPNTHDFRWDSVYAYRAIPVLKAQLRLGENYLVSDLFDSFRYTGASLVSDVNMSPPNLRGYAPEVTGVAQTNATVIVSQQGRIIYQTQVPAGPFRIQNLSDTVSGTLNVRIEEQDGSVREYTVDTASIPYLTRPGEVRFKTSVGRPSTYDHKVYDSFFATGEFSWGISNRWSLFGGSLNSKDYNALSVGVGRDLLMFGALSFDMTQSFADLPDADTNKDKNFEGRSYRINYAKTFDKYNSQIQFAGYRFSEKNFLSMTDYLALKDASNSGTSYSGRNKEMYTVTLSKNFLDYKTSVYLNLNHQTYWDRPDRDYYNLMVNKTVDFASIKNINLALSAYHSKSESNEKDYGAYLSVTVPLNSGPSINYAISSNRTETTNQVSYYDNVNDRTTYQLSAAYSDQTYASASAYVTHIGERARVTASVSNDNKSSAIGLSAQGGVTLTAQGVDFHRVSSMGSTRILLDTDKVKNVPVKANGPFTTSNRFGKAIVADVTNYYRNKVRIDMNALPEKVEATSSIAYSTLTEGAIGYRKFSVMSGEKKIFTLRSEDGVYLPFGTQILNENGRVTGIVDENGSTYLSGISIKQKMVATVGDDKKCFISFTEQDLVNDQNNSLVCRVE